jgi:hypothetical protein
MEKRPSKGIIISGVAVIIFSLLQLLFVPYTFREFSFLPIAATIACTVYLIVYNFTAVVAATYVLKLRQGARGLLILILLLGIFDKLVFVPLRLRALDRAKTEPQLRSLLVKEYRKVLAERNQPQPASDDAVIQKVVHDLHTAQGGVEIAWVLFPVSLLVFYSNPNVRKQFKSPQPA